MGNLFNKVINGKQFNFQPMEIGTETVYHTDVKDEAGMRWEFRIVHAAGNTLAIEGEQLPPWIAELTKELSNAINERE